MAAYRRVYDSRHLQADSRTGISSGTLRSVIEYGLPIYTHKWRTCRDRRLCDVALTVCVVGAGRAALTGKHDTLVRRAHQMLNAALGAMVGGRRFDASTRRFAGRQYPDGRRIGST